MEKEMIIVLDFGGQYNQLIARRVRECNVYCEVHPYTLPLEKIKEMNPKGIIFTGGPNSVYKEESPRCSKEIFDLGIPVLGICYGVGVEYRTHIQSKGWEKTWKKDGETSGTSGEAKRLEAIQIRLTGTNKNKYDIYYRVQAQTYGWLGWVKNGAYAGTAGQAKRLEAIQIIIMPKTDYPTDYEGFDGTIGGGFVDMGKNPTTDGSGAVSYMTHVQSYGNQKWVSDGSISGTSGEGKRLEAISIKVNNAQLNNISGGIAYTTHVQTYGWSQGWKYNGAASGTRGEGKRLEAIRIQLTGQLAQYYDVYYRVHAQTYGWLGWAKNGSIAGTSGLAKRLEAIQIVIIPKGEHAPNPLPAAPGAAAYVH